MSTREPEYYTLSEIQQARLDNLARELDDHQIGNTKIYMDWGNVAIECFDPSLKALLRDLAVDYTRLRKIVEQMPPEQLRRYEK